VTACKRGGAAAQSGHIEIDSNAVECAIRPIALSGKNALFASHDSGAEHWAVITSLFETCKMNVIDPHVWLPNTLTAIGKGHKQRQIDDPLPWSSAAKV
jgi:transposase